MVVGFSKSDIRWSLWRGSGTLSHTYPLELERGLELLCGQGSEPPAHRSGLTEEETHPVDLSSLSSKLLPGFSFTTLGFKDERRSKGEYREGHGWEHHRKGSSSLTCLQNCTPF